MYPNIIIEKVHYIVIIVMGGVHFLMLVMDKYMSRITSIMENRKPENAVSHIILCVCVFSKKVKKRFKNLY